MRKKPTINTEKRMPKSCSYLSNFKLLQFARVDHMRSTTHVDEIAASIDYSRIRLNFRLD